LAYTLKEDDDDICYRVASLHTKSVRTVTAGHLYIPQTVPPAVPMTLALPAVTVFPDLLTLKSALRQLNLTVRNIRQVENTVDINSTTRNNAIS
jgi:hypothetical protein